ncbi:MAG: right-handed parallel beta-helix repeat-containing protein, partial [Candidatus Omnitrophica bacterium]|nr:right-handed parallel beta-helix repeat-containing protein [Candidatus Omnitrophota bacterium]
PSVDISPEYGGATGWIIANNTIANENDRAAIVVWGAVKNSRIVNNIFYENGRNRAGAYAQGIDFVFSAATPPSGLVVNNNISYATAPGGTVFMGGSGATQGVHYTQSGNIVNTANPDFFDPAAGDFGLRLLSPAIDAGATVSEVTQDFTGDPRPNGPNYDIGAFEGSGSHPDPLSLIGGGPGGGGSGTPCCQ